MHWITSIEGGPKRVNHAAVSMGSKIYTFGGYCSGESLREYVSMDVHVLNTKTFRWTKHPVSELPYFENDDILPFKRYGHTAVSYGDNIYIWGGKNDRTCCAVLFCFDTVWHCWTAPTCTGDIPFARDGHTACVWRNKMIVFGGYEEDCLAFAKSMYILNLDTKHWSHIITSGEEPSLRDFHTAVCIGDRMYVFGGRGSVATNGIYLPRDERYSSNLWYLDLHENKWYNTKATGDIPIGRRSHSAFVYNEKMYIFGGYNAVLGHHFNDTYVYDPKTNEWTALSPNYSPPCRRRRQACIAVDDRVFLFGGTSPIDGTEENTRNDYLYDSDRKLNDHSDMYVLDFKPTLKTLALIVTQKYKLDMSILPANLRTEYSNMFNANNITMNRPNHSAG
ncbi:PREDICTED: kelch domain-containing protein 3-like [Nicrophorus vespilloides]|uniref:Kelch domain-containing protein 3-like n=1 Tax=Nicrophorus vespilloides TaxID=110193 RepID=A0ABM1MC94_NICVS|nr:PREDICTED: kelch domain-containing protein 3-like [Nicrophorus vespilloides]